MTEIIIDRDKCIGCGLCVSLCPECFELDEENKSRAIKQDCQGLKLDEVAEDCPVQAITIKK